MAAKVNGADAHVLRERITGWAESIRDHVDGAWPEMPVGIEDRNADVWEALLAVADEAGTTWAERARVAAVALVAHSKRAVPSLGVQLLGDLRNVFEGHDVLSTDDVINGLLRLDESPWGDLRGKELDARGLARRLAKYDIKPRVHRIGATTPRGYAAVDLSDAWSRYLPSLEIPDAKGTVQQGPPPYGSATSATSATTARPSVAAVALVAHSAGDCTVCGFRLDPVLVADGHATHPNCDPPESAMCSHGVPVAAKCGACIAERLNARAGVV